jgi:Kdo2-lipid IVA lauroyltransferase/acyltransferase
MMASFLYYVLLAIARMLQALPVRLVAAVGRFGGGIVYLLDFRHRRVASENLRRCFPEKTDAERQGIAREHFKRLGENFASAIPTAGMSDAQIAPHLEIVGAEKLNASPRGAIVAIGHFGNFELYTHLTTGVPHLQAAATYRALQHRCLDRLVRELRRRSGCVFYDRRRDVKAMLSDLRRGGIVLGLLSDQHAGRNGVRIPFFGNECSTTIAPAKLALRYRLPLYTAVCFRVGLGRWRIELSEEIATHIGPESRPTAEIMADVNAAFETAIRRDVPNSFWVYDRWRFAKAARAVAREAKRQAGRNKSPVLPRI